MRASTAHPRGVPDDGRGAHMTLHRELMMACDALADGGLGGPARGFSQPESKEE